MFGKPRQQAAQVTVLAAGSALEGTIRARGALQIDGAVCGTVTAAGQVSVGSEGRLLGELRGTQISVGGRVDGIVYARRHLLVLGSGAVRGHARYQSLEIERGGIVEGTTSNAVEEPSERDEELAEGEYVAAE